MPERFNKFSRGPEVPESPKDASRDRNAEDEFRRRTEGLVSLIKNNRGSKDLVAMVKDFLTGPERGFRMADPMNPEIGIHIDPKPGNRGVLITVFGQKRRIDIDPDDWGPAGNAPDTDKK